MRTAMFPAPVPMVIPAVISPMIPPVAVIAAVAVIPPVITPGITVVIPASEPKRQRWRRDHHWRCPDVRRPDDDAGQRRQWQPDVQADPGIRGRGSPQPQ